MPINGLGYDIHGRNDEHADVRKGIDKEAFFWFSRRLGHVSNENCSVSL